MENDTLQLSDDLLFSLGIKSGSQVEFDDKGNLHCRDYDNEGKVTYDFKFDDAKIPSMPKTNDDSYLNEDIAALRIKTKSRKLLFGVIIVSLAIVTALAVYLIANY